MQPTRSLCACSKPLMQQAPHDLPPTRTPLRSRQHPERHNSGAPEVPKSHVVEDLPGRWRWRSRQDDDAGVCAQGVQFRLMVSGWFRVMVDISLAGFGLFGPVGAELDDLLGASAGHGAQDVATRFTRQRPQVRNLHAHQPKRFSASLPRAICQRICQKTTAWTWSTPGLHGVQAVYRANRRWPWPVCTSASFGDLVEVLYVTLRQSRSALWPGVASSCAVCAARSRRGPGGGSGCGARTPPTDGRSATGRLAALATRRFAGRLDCRSRPAR